MKATSSIEFTNYSGEVIMSETYASELVAQNAFDEISSIRWPMTYKGLRINTSEWFCSMHNGSMRLVVTNDKTGERYIRRELCRAI